MSSARSVAGSRNEIPAHLMNQWDQVSEPLSYIFIDELAPRLEAVAQRRLPRIAGQSKSYARFINSCEKLRDQARELNASRKSLEAIIEAQKLKLDCEEKLQLYQSEEYAVQITYYLVEALFGEATALRAQSAVLLSQNRTQDSLRKSQEALELCRSVNALKFVDPEMKTRMLKNVAILLHDIGSVKFKLSLELLRSNQLEEALVGSHEVLKIYEEILQISSADQIPIPHVKKSFCTSIQLHTIILMQQVFLLKNQKDYPAALQKAKEVEACAKTAMARFPEVPILFCDIASGALNEQALVCNETATHLMRNNNFSDALIQLNWADLACIQAMALNPSKETLISLSDNLLMILQQKIEMLSADMLHSASVHDFRTAFPKAKQIENLCFRALGLFSANPQLVKSLKERRDWAVQSQEALRKKIEERAFV